LVPQQKVGFPIPNPAFCSVSKGQRRLGEKEHRARSVTPGVALRVGIQDCPGIRIASGTTSASIAPDIYEIARLASLEQY
jgi:hypothetical protein